LATDGVSKSSGPGTPLRPFFGKEKPADVECTTSDEVKQAHPSTMPLWVGSSMFNGSWEYLADRLLRGPIGSPLSRPVAVGGPTIQNAGRCPGDGTNPTANRHEFRIEIDYPCWRD
jgi:hypothetical protein